MRDLTKTSENRLNLKIGKLFIFLKNSSDIKLEIKFNQVKSWNEAPNEATSSAHAFPSQYIWEHKG